jgi:hypothetical protein
MKKVRYHWSDKLQTLWASIVVGCNHTVEINDRLGSHEHALAAFFGLDRFPDQSQVNRLLSSFSAEHLTQWRQLHLDLLSRHTRARDRSLWLKLANGERMLVLDLDQRALVVSSQQFEFAAAGFFGRKRGPRGYQLSVAFLGGGVGEVLDEYFDPGNTPISNRVDDLLASLEWFCRRTGLGLSDILIRGDAQLGTPANIRKIKEQGCHYLFKGLSPRRAQKLTQAPGHESSWREVFNGQERAPALVCDLGEHAHRDESGKRRGAKLWARTLLLKRKLKVHRRKRPSQSGRRRLTAEGQIFKEVEKVDYFLTDLNEAQLPIEQLLEVYHDRSTIERYFYDEQYSLGARQVRTHRSAGAALFQFLVATTNNLLRWMQHTAFQGTVVEQLGLGRVTRAVMQIPGKIKKRGQGWVVELPRGHYLVKLLMKNWGELRVPSG